MTSILTACSQRTQPLKSVQVLKPSRWLIFIDIPRVLTSNAQSSTTEGNDLQMYIISTLSKPGKIINTLYQLGPKDSEFYT